MSDIADPHDTFAGKVALVTGGATGIGAAASRAFAARGAQVIIAARRRDKAEATIAKIEAQGGRAAFIQTDLTDPTQIEALHDGILDEYGRLDIAFNNAGYQEAKAPLVDQTPDVYTRVFDTNVRAVFLSLRRQIQAMKGRGGAIVVNASVSGMKNPNPGFSIYSASKAAVISLTKSAAMEAAEQGVRINVIAPGRVVTDMMLSSQVMDMKAVAAGLPIRRMGEPQEVANAVVWLASDAASFVVGHVLAIDGGFMAT
ncbi:glucose 1-dehydrogenase [uncultured Roseobacter sp.]|uniref:glucose 1-dehydrogenase n=1 Tax=uncultured Roseobacter sp. TaxID=114847 RepID=UPI002625A3CD|nr:glucose 1-dehydrogenase [uncultured Roseobacter sp.]